MMQLLQATEKQGKYTQPRQEFAHFSQVDVAAFADRIFAVTNITSAEGSSKPSDVFCQHRYPSPCRSVLTPNRPANPFVATPLANFYRSTGSCLVFDVVQGETRAITKTKGIGSCRNVTSSSQQWLHSACQLASKQTVSVRSSARALAALQMKLSATETALTALLSVLSVARSLTTLLAAKPHTLYHYRSDAVGDETPAAFAV